MSAITGSMYRGIVNAHLHNGLNEYSMEYEFGFVYGGLFVLGYCQFIHEYVQTHHIDKILFLARDGDILIKFIRSYILRKLIMRLCLLVKIGSHKDGGLLF